MPRTVLCPLLYSFRKGSEAALIAHVTEHRGGPAELGRVSQEPRKRTGERAWALGELQGALPDAHSQKLVRAQVGPLWPRLNTPWTNTLGASSGPGASGNLNETNVLCGLAKRPCQKRTRTVNSGIVRASMIHGLPKLVPVLWTLLPLPQRHLLPIRRTLSEWIPRGPCWKLLNDDKWRGSIAGWWKVLRMILVNDARQI
jgi:hypothetical protein